MYKLLWTTILLFVNYARTTENNMEGFIMEGDFTNILMYPHQVYIEIYGDDDTICGGSILNQAIVLTAAHCLGDYDGKKNQRVIINYGSDNIKYMKMMTAMKSYKIHEKYNYATLQGDLALVGCKSPIRLGRFVQKVVIMKDPPSDTHTVAYVSGWGATNKNYDMPDVLKHTKQILQNAHVCKKLDTPKGAFCAGPVHGPGTPSVGDSGGALVINRYIQIGIVSYKVEGYTLVSYTNVSYYYSWIMNTAADLYCNH